MWGGHVELQVVRLFCAEMDTGVFSFFVEYFMMFSTIFFFVSVSKALARLLGVRICVYSAESNVLEFGREMERREEEKKRERSNRKEDQYGKVAVGRKVR